MKTGVCSSHQKVLYTNKGRQTPEQEKIQGKEINSSVSNVSLMYNKSNLT